MAVQPADFRKEEVEWSTALLDCFEDPATCCYGFWCGPCLACTVAGRLKECYCLPLCDYCMPGGIPPAALGLRVGMRKQFNIKGSVLKDICISWCCPWCSWCQMHRELKRRSKVPTVVNVQNVVQMQPAPMMMPQSNMMMQQSNMMMPQSNMMMQQSPMMMQQAPMMMPQAPMMMLQDPMMMPQDPMMMPQDPMMMPQDPMMMPQDPMMMPQDSKMSTADK